MVYLLNMVIFHGYVSHNQRVDTKSNGFPTANIRQFVMWKTPWVSPEIWSSNVFFPHQTDGPNGYPLVSLKMAIESSLIYPATMWGPQDS